MPQHAFILLHNSDYSIVL